MQNISDEQLKAYFLGKLPEPEAETLEVECASDDEIFERAQAVERELMDDYLRGNLSAADLHLYESNYLVTEARQKNLLIAAELWKIAAEPPAPAPSAPVALKSSPSFWQTIFGRRPAAVGFAFASMLLLLALGAVVIYLSSSAVNKSEVAEVKDPIQSAKPETPAFETPDQTPVQDLTPEDQSPPPVSSDRNLQSKEPRKDADSPVKNQPDAKAMPAAKPVKPVNPTVLMTVKLLPGSLRAEDGEQSVSIAPGVKNLHFLLNPAGEPNNYKVYRVTLRTPENGAVFSLSDLKSLSFKIAAEKLESRTYIIALEGKNQQNEYESIADYTFRVRR